ncbi:MAG: hypothetical protein COA79_02040 [Planctomycetota bacterium]|nr:MAG: hypothetical protein COA79_02040 [Planctomycetota bacterium]
MKTKVCSDCNISFNCFSDSKDSNCWCSVLPNIMTIEEQSDCKCSSCLTVAINEKIENLISNTAIDELVELASKHKEDSCTEGIDYCIENEMHVFSKWYLLKQGSCCDNNCKNCPY